jgi:hypothetical protein
MGGPIGKGTVELFLMAACKVAEEVEAADAVELDGSDVVAACFPPLRRSGERRAGDRLRLRPYCL